MAEKDKCLICDLPAPDTDDWHSHHKELDRLRVVNAQLLEALDWYARDYPSGERARAAIEETRK